jgi:hypothetical protein
MSRKPWTLNTQHTLLAIQCLFEIDARSFQQIRKSWKLEQENHNKDQQ